MLLCAAAALGPVSDAAPAKTSTTVADPVVHHCLVKVMQEAKVPGREAGVLVALEAKEGLTVKAGAVLGRVDDSEPTSQKRIKMKEHDVEKEKATNDVNVRYARKATDVAKATYDKSKKANETREHVISEVEMLKQLLEWKKAELQIEQAQHELKIAEITSDVKEAEVDATDLAIRRRQIASPLDGIVVKVYSHVGEWVAPGDPVLHIVQVDHLQVEAFLNASEYSPTEIDGRPVTVEVEMARGRKEKFPGKIVFVSPLVEGGGEYRLLAEVVNRQENGQWLLRPGHLATMTIKLH
jgi:multidrug efflux pump subunit AcrA (membrane-fusion protein)